VIKISIQKYLLPASNLYKTLISCKVILNRLIFKITMNYIILMIDFFLGLFILFAAVTLIGNFFGLDEYLKYEPDNPSMEHIKVESSAHTTYLVCFSYTNDQ